jgi:hypothetical protein
MIYNMYAMIPNKKIPARAANIIAIMKIMIPFIIFPAYTVPIPGKKKDIIKANMGFAIIVFLQIVLYIIIV